MGRRMGLLAVLVSLAAVGCGDEDDTGTSAAQGSRTADGEAPALPDPITSGDAPKIAIAERLVEQIGDEDGADWMIPAFGSLWVKRGDGDVIRVNPDGVVVARIRSGGFSGTVCQGIGASSELIWSCPEEGIIDRIDPKTNRIVDSLRVDKAIDQGRVHEVAGKLWFATDAGKVLVGVDPESGETETEIDLDANCPSLAADANTIWAACYFDDRLIAIDAERGEILGETELSGPASMDFGESLWVGFDEGLAEVDPETLEIAALYDVFPGLTGSIHATGDRVWVRVQGGPFLTLVDPVTGEIAETIVAPKLPSGGDVVEFAGSVWATATEEGTLIRLELP